MMDPSDIDLSHDELKALEDPDSGIELDKIELPAPRESHPPPLSGRPPEPPKAAAVAEGASHRPAFIWIAGLAAGLILVVVLAVFMLKVTGAFGIFSMEGKTSVRYRRIDPIITNLGEHHHARILLRVRLDPESKARMMSLTPAIIDSILTFVASPEIQKMIRNADPETLAALVRNEISAFVKREHRHRVVLEEIEIY